MYQLALSLWRTCVPYVVAFLVVQAARLGIHLDNASATSALVTGFGTAYYAAFRFLEHRFGASWGWFLGAARPPSYQTTDPGATPKPAPGSGPGAAPKPEPEPEPKPEPESAPKAAPAPTTAPAADTPPVVPEPTPAPTPAPEPAPPAPTPAPTDPPAARPDYRNLPEGG
ncbi:hypothetical protein ACGF13_09250 [Kitasatospora sp. NPDC048286]|uniref:hypothetical protein n=1 Tax=Kitasatospora sp. NPDC048286 TaxID=3364047 RepID=UPI003722EF5A